MSGCFFLKHGVCDQLYYVAFSSTLQQQYQIYAAAAICHQWLIYWKKNQGPITLTTRTL